MSGGSAAGGWAALSSLNDNVAGAESVVHRTAEGVPELPPSRATRLSNSAIALSLLSSAVTTRRMSAAVAAEHASRMVAIAQNILAIIGSSYLPKAR